jgi:hypothetical protein
MTEHPQVVIGEDGTTADERIAPLVALVRRHGLATHGSCQGGLEEDADGGESTTFSPAYLVFHTAPDALEFLLQTAHAMDYQIGDQVALVVHRPLSGDSPGAKVIWHPDLTPQLYASWAAR